jgi:hypothetical protein
MPALPWKSFATPEGDGEYLALLSHLPLNKFSAMPKFFRYTRQIQRQLVDSEGLIGHSLEANIPGKQFWTLSVWEDEEHLRRFVQQIPHSRIMTDLLPDMGQTKFFSWNLPGSSVPPNWEEAKRRMRER